jgi:hypothetical protein
MANIIGIQEIVNGPRNYVVKIDIEGDGAGDETDFELIQADYLECDNVRLDKFWSSLVGFSASLIWDGPTPVPFLQIPAGFDISQDLTDSGGWPNPKVANYTGNVSLATSGLGAGEKGTMELHFTKKGAV